MKTEGRDAGSKRQRARWWLDVAGEGSESSNQERLLEVWPQLGRERWGCHGYPPWAQLRVTQLWGPGPDSTGRQKTELSRNVDEAIQGEAPGCYVDWGWIAWERRGPSAQAKAAAHL